MKKQNLISLLVFLLLVSLDQLTKYFAIQNLKGQAAFVIIEDVFELHYLENTGAAFGILQNKQIILLFITLIFLAASIFVFLRMPAQKKYLPLRSLLLLVSAGAVGNMIDRLRFQYVVDFLYFKLIDFPIFNIADCYVTISAFGLLVLILFYYKEEDFDFLQKKEKK